MRKINKAGLELIKFYEEFRAKPYQDTGGVWTQGYGTTRGITARSTPIDEETAVEWLEDGLRSSEASVERLITYPLNDNEFSALVSFVYNLGGGALQRSTMRSMLNRGDFSDASNEFPKWVYDNGVRLRGLERRRAAERELFLTPDNRINSVQLSNTNNKTNKKSWFWN